MEINARQYLKVEIKPIDVIEKMIEEELGGWRNWVIEKDGGYYIGNEVSMGSHSSEEYEAISKEKYDYIKALEFIKYTITKQK